MKIISIILTLILSVSYVSADYTYNKPNIVLLDKDKQPVPNIPKSTSSARCLQKASNLPTGTYYCRQPDITVTVTNNTTAHPPNNTVLLTWTAPTENIDGSNLTDLARFKIYYGTSPNELITAITITDAAIREYKITDLNPSIKPTTYYFAMTAVNANRVESSLSTISSKVIN